MRGKEPLGRSPLQSKPPFLSGFRLACRLPPILDRSSEVMMQIPDGHDNLQRWDHGQSNIEVSACYTKLVRPKNAGRDQYKCYTAADEYLGEQTSSAKSSHENNRVNIVTGLGVGSSNRVFCDFHPFALSYFGSSW
jgi:hypothetical protein